MRDVQEDPTIDVGVPATEHFESIQFGLRWLGMPLDRVALGIRRGRAVIELDDGGPDEGGELGSRPVQTDVARLRVSSCNLCRLAERTHIQQPPLDPQHPTSNPLSSVNVGLLGRALHIPLPLLIVGCVGDKDT